MNKGKREASEERQTRDTRLSPSRVSGAPHSLSTCLHKPEKRQKITPVLWVMPLLARGEFHSRSRISLAQLSPRHKWGTICSLHRMGGGHTFLLSSFSWSLSTSDVRSSPSRPVTRSWFSFSWVSASLARLRVVRWRFLWLSSSSARFFNWTLSDSSLWTQMKREPFNWVT